VMLRHEQTSLCLTKFGALAGCLPATRPRRTKTSAVPPVSSHL
jgi:hypothetical protein